MRNQIDDFSILVEDLLQFVAGRNFDVAVVEYEVTDGGSSMHKWLELGSVIIEVGIPKNRELLKQAHAVAISLVQETSKQSGARAWGLQFRLWPNGQFKVEYNYKKPTWIDEFAAEEAAALAEEIASLSPQEKEERTALEWLRATSAAQSSEWGLGTELRWNVDVPKGLIVWTFESGSRQAPIQLVGTQDKVDHTFRWAWANSSVPENLRVAVNQLRHWARVRNFHELENESCVADEIRVWSWTAICAKLCGKEGAYRVDNGSTWLYLVFGKQEASHD